jgi:hypothetical protein
MISFGLSPDVCSSDLQLVYRRREYSFDIAGPHPPECKASISVNEVQMEYGDDMHVRCVTGYCPYQGWKETDWSPPCYCKAGLVVVNPQEIIPGVAVAVNPTTRWAVHVNREGWVCLGEPSERGQKAIEFAPTCVAVLNGGKLVGLWLCPLMIGD